MSIVQREFDAYLDELDIITIIMPTSYYEGKSSYFNMANPHEQVTLTVKEVISLDGKMKYSCQLDRDLDLGTQHWVYDEHGGKTDVQIGMVVRTRRFDESFYYSRADLGVHYHPTYSMFKLWAPTAISVKIKLKQTRTSVAEIYEMIRTDKGVWELRVDQNLEGYRYTYLVCVNSEWREAVDPYARSVSANGQEGFIVDMAKTRLAPVSLPPFKSAVDAIIYELHLRDFTIHPNSGVKAKGTYIGASELGTQGEAGDITGLSYIKDLGITHIELLPLNDFAGVDELECEKNYNWGYNPLHFNAPEGSYSSNPDHPYARINELKQMITTMQKQGLRVILDVVYNHVYIWEQSNFEKIVPGYYFRFDEGGNPSNGTGVGNDIASERLMVRKFILDSALFWVNEYHVNGFRFDLMGILDITTMNLIREAMDEMDPSIIILGEGWDLPTLLPADQKATIHNQHKIKCIAHFNDRFRDTIKGSTFNLNDKGYIYGNEAYYEATKNVLTGSIDFQGIKSGIFSEPTQSVNYIEAHDNHTLWDKLLICDDHESDDVKQLRHRLATVMVLLAQGIPFLHSGQEFFRTKKGIGNSYRSPDHINQLDWDRKFEYIENVNYIKGIIELRKSHQAFRFRTSELIRKHFKFYQAPHPIIAYTLNNVKEYGEWDTLFVLFNPTLTPYYMEFRGHREWNLLVDDRSSGCIPIETFYEKTVTIQPISTYVVGQN